MNTENEIKYLFSDFTTNEFRKLIQALKAKSYTFRGFADFAKTEQFVLWRHDIDFSPQRALACAKIENSEGVKGTYFLHLHSEYYNLLEKNVFNIIKEIIELGHDIGVHFDTHFYNIKSEAEIIEHLGKERDFLNYLYNVDIKTFSFHNTNAFILTCNKWEYAGLINTYASYFKEELKYCSDSNGYWRYQRMKDVINEERGSLHLLTHCEWWTDEVMSPWQKIQRAINGRANFAKQHYLEFLKESKMLNIDYK
ncbi:MAG: hypothetical protein IPO27_02490 [Bacteroidetes bacterium]|nr:hypothetical protein [Bacteroidota bacterium]